LEAEVNTADRQSSALRKGIVMRKRGFVLGAVLILATILPAPLAGAAQPLDVTFKVSVFAGTFTATGSAVTEGLMCEGGTIFNEEPPRYAGNSHVVTNARVITEFTCVGGDFDSATFVIKHQLHIDLSDPVSWTVNWVLKDGTKEFEHLRGNGHGNGYMLAEPPFGPFDTLVGQLH
jgi:hypothetical protein